MVAAANVETVFSGAGKFVEEAPSTGPAMLKIVVSLHYNWKYSFLHPTLNEVTERYNQKWPRGKASRNVTEAAVAAAAAKLVAEATAASSTSATGTTGGCCCRVMTELCSCQAGLGADCGGRGKRTGGEVGVRTAVDMDVTVSSALQTLDMCACETSVVS